MSRTQRKLQTPEPQNPKPQTPEPQIPKPQTPAPRILNPVDVPIIISHMLWCFYKCPFVKEFPSRWGLACPRRVSQRNRQACTLNPKLSTPKPQHSTLNPEPSTLNPRPQNPRRSRHRHMANRSPISEHGSHKSVKAGLWPWHSGRGPWNVASCSLFARKWSPGCLGAFRWRVALFHPLISQPSPPRRSRRRHKTSRSPIGWGQWGGRSSETSET